MSPSSLEGNAKREWTVAGVLAIIYAGLFGLIAGNIFPNKLLFGFCVAGSPDEPNKDIGCGESRPLNSHFACLPIGMVALALLIVLFFMDKNRRAKSVGLRETTYFVLMFIKTVHAVLHWFLQQTSVGSHDFIVNCYRDFSAIFRAKSILVIVGNIVFFIFSFCLSFIFLFLDESEFTSQNAIISVILAGLVVLVAWATEFQLVLPSLFVMAHLLTSYLGFKSTPPKDPESSGWVFQSKAVADLFIFTTSVGLIELLSCPELMKPLGGHAWYDFALCATAVAAAPYFSFPDHGKKKN